LHAVYPITTHPIDTDLLHTHVLFLLHSLRSHFFFFNDPATTEIYTFPTRRSSDLAAAGHAPRREALRALRALADQSARRQRRGRSEEHTSELQSPYDLVCRLLHEKKKTG